MFIPPNIFIQLLLLLFHCSDLRFCSSLFQAFYTCPGCPPLYHCQGQFSLDNTSFPDPSFYSKLRDPERTKACPHLHFVMTSFYSKPELDPLPHQTLLQEYEHLKETNKYFYRSNQNFILLCENIEEQIDS